MVKELFIIKMEVNWKEIGKTELKMESFDFIKTRILMIILLKFMKMEYKKKTIKTI